MTMLPLDPIPEYQPLLQAEANRLQATPQANGYLSDVWYRWLSALVTRVLACLLRIDASNASKSNQSAAISATTLITPSQTGIYVVVWYLRITTADGVSSSATVTVSWKDAGNACSKVFPAITGNTITTSDSGIAICKPDAAQPIQYSVAYASNTPAQMHYALTLAVVQVS